MTTKSVDVIVIGNGIIADSISANLMWHDSKLKVAQIGPKPRIGSATQAAAAMLNSFAEVDKDTFSSPISEERFRFNRYADRLVWERFLARINSLTGQPVNHGFGTFVINNSKSGVLEDENFDAIVRALDLERAKYEFVSPGEIHKYQPVDSVRALRAVYIADEGWVNPVQLLTSLDYVLSKFDNHEVMNSEVVRLNYSNSRVKSVETSDGAEVFADTVLLANGAGMTDLMKRSNLGGMLLPVYRGVGVTVILETAADTLVNCVRTPNRGLACGLYAAPRDDSHTIIGATNAIWDIPRTTPTLNNISTLLQNARTELNQNFDRAAVVGWNVGWRPITEDLMPMIGETEVGGLFVANGMRRDGFHCSPVIGEIVADLLLRRKPRFEIGSFGPRATPLQILSREASINRIVEHTLAAAVEHGFVPGHVNQGLRLERAIRSEANTLHDWLGLSETGIQPEFFSYFEGRRRRAEEMES